MVNNKFQKGFTLIELSIVVAVAAVLLSSAAVFFGNKTMVDKARRTRQKMETIAEAVKIYVNVNGHLPCPASLLDNPDNTSLGDGYMLGGLPCASDTLTPNPGVLFSSSSDTSTDDDDFKATNVLIGAVPVAQLGLPVQYMFDEWGNKISYFAPWGLVQNQPAAGTDRTRDTWSTHYTPDDIWENGTTHAFDSYPNHWIPHLPPTLNNASSYDIIMPASSIGILLPNGDSAIKRIPKSTDTGKFRYQSCWDNTTWPTSDAAPTNIYTFATPISDFTPYPDCAAFAIVSHGANGWLSYTAGGTQIANSYGTNSGGSNQNQNQLLGSNHYHGAVRTSSGFSIQLIDNPIQPDMNSSTYFDDIVVYRSKDAIMP